LTVVGLPDAAVQEARERVRAAIKNSGRVFTCCAWRCRTGQGKECRITMV